MTKKTATVRSANADEIYMSRYLILKTKNGKTEGIDAEGNVRIFDTSASKIIADLCLSSCATIDGRRNGAREIFGWHQKVPVLISELTQEIWFPLAGEKAEENCWISYGCVFSFHKENEYQTRIVFINGTKETVDANVRTVRMQMRRCEEMLKYLNEQKENQSFVHGIEILK